MSITSTVTSSGRNKRSYTPKDWVIIPSDMPLNTKIRLLDGALFPAESVRCRPQHPRIDRCSHSEIRLSGAVIPKLLWYSAVCGEVLAGSPGTLL